MACYDRKYTDRETVLDFIKKEIAKITLHYQKDRDYLADQLVPNEFRNPYDVNYIENRKKQYHGPRGFDGALATGTDIIMEDELDLNKLKNNDDILNANKTNKTKSSKGKNSAFFTKNDLSSKYRKLDKRTRERIEEIKKKKENPNHLDEEFEDAQKQREQQLQEYADLNLTAKDFFSLNFRSRNILINALNVISLFHPRWKKLTMLMTEIALLLLSTSVFLTLDEKVTSHSIPRCIVFALISTLGADFVLYLLAFFFVFPSIKVRRLLYLVKEGGNLIILKEWDEMSKIQGYKALIGYIVCFIIWVISFYVTFGFTVVWKYQNGAFYLCLILGFVFDFLFLELIVEGIVALFFYKRREIAWMRYVGEFLNRLRDYICMSP